MTPFVKNPLGIICFLLMAIWTVSGILLGVIPGIPALLKGIWWLWLPVFIFVPMLGPAVITISQAVGPIMDKP